MMKLNIKNIFRENSYNFLQIYKNKFKNKKIIILSCGPSLQKFHERIDEIKKNRKKYIIFSIKQAHKAFNEMTDIHFINTGNLEKYSYKKGQKIILGTDNSKNIIFNNFDYTYHVNHAKKLSSLNFNKEFFLSDENIKNRAHGPSIMLEIVLPFAIYCGGLSIETYGWDHLKRINKKYYFNDIKKNNEIIIFKEFKITDKKYLGFINTFVSFFVFYLLSLRNYVFAYKYNLGQFYTNKKKLKLEIKKIRKNYKIVKKLALAKINFKIN